MLVVTVKVSMYVCTLSVAYLCNKISQFFFVCVCVEPSSES